MKDPPVSSTSVVGWLPRGSGVPDEALGRPELGAQHEPVTCSTATASPPFHATSG